MNELQGERLLELLGERFKVRLFSIREHGHIIDGDGVHFCVPEGARVIVMTPMQENARDDMERLAFALGEAGAMVSPSKMRMPAPYRRFDIRAGDPQADDSDLPF